MTSKPTREIIQSYIITSAIYDYNAVEKRIMQKVVENLQKYLEGQNLDSSFYIKQVDMNMSITIKTKDLLLSEQDKNYSRIKAALEKMLDKKIKWESKKDGWGMDTLIASPRVSTDGSTINFNLTPAIAEAMLDFSRGFRKYQLAVAMHFSSTYTMRFYEMFSNQSQPITYNIETLKTQFKLEGKYKQTSDFIKYVIEPAKRDLDKHAPYSFRHIALKKGRKITSIRFIPYHLPKNDASKKSGLTFTNTPSLKWTLSAQEKDYLVHNFDFSEAELKRNYATFNKLQKLGDFDLFDFLQAIREKIQSGAKIKNAKGYLIGALKKEIERLEGGSSKYQHSTHTPTE